MIQIKYQNVKTSYLSNEIFYRVAYLREKYNKDLPSGHLHIGFLSKDKFTDRDDMIEDIKYILRKFPCSFGYAIRKLAVLGFAIRPKASYKLATGYFQIYKSERAG